MLKLAAIPTVSALVDAARSRSRDLLSDIGQKVEALLNQPVKLLADIGQSELNNVVTMALN